MIYFGKTMKLSKQNLKLRQKYIVYSCPRHFFPVKILPSVFLHNGTLKKKKKKGTYCKSMVSLCRFTDKLLIRRLKICTGGLLKKHKLECCVELWRYNTEKHFNIIVYEFRMIQHLYRQRQHSMTLADLRKLEGRINHRSLFLEMKEILKGRKM